VTAAIEPTRKRTRQRNKTRLFTGGVLVYGADAEDAEESNTWGEFTTHLTCQVLVSQIDGYILLHTTTENFCSADPESMVFPQT
jgi:hypothetical protein